MKSATPIDFNDYISAFPENVQWILSQIRSIIRETEPLATESISYGMPAFKLNGKPLVYFAGYKHHIGLYATPSAHAEFASELKPYKQGKGSVQFPLDEPIPSQLVKKIIAFRAAENLSMAQRKKNQ